MFLARLSDPRHLSVASCYYALCLPVVFFVRCRDARCKSFSDFYANLAAFVEFMMEIKGNLQWENLQNAVLPTKTSFLEHFLLKIQLFSISFSNFHLGKTMILIWQP